METGDGSAELTPTREVRLDRMRALRCDLRAYRLFRQFTKAEYPPHGLSILRGELEQGINEDTIAEFLFAMAASADPALLKPTSPLTLDQLRELITLENIDHLVDVATGLYLDSVTTRVRHTTAGEDTEDGGAEDGGDEGEALRQPQAAPSASKNSGRAASVGSG